MNTEIWGATNYHPTLCKIWYLDNGPYKKLSISISQHLCFPGLECPIKTDYRSYVSALTVTIGGGPHTWLLPHPHTHIHSAALRHNLQVYHNLEISALCPFFKATFSNVSSLPDELSKLSFLVLYIQMINNKWTFILCYLEFFCLP